MKTLKAKLTKVLGQQRAELHEVIENHGEQVVAEIRAGQIFSGARGIRALLCNTSRVPSDRGLIVRGHPIGELTEKTPEEIFYLLLIGTLPGPDELAELRREFVRRGDVPDYVWNVLDALPPDAHPMGLLSSGVLCMQRESHFARRYASGMPKGEYWEAAFEDALTLLARLPAIAAWVYRKRFKKGPRIEADPELDWAANYARMLGLPGAQDEFAQLLRLYLVLHCDHGGGNVSAMTAAAVNSALSDLYYSLSAGLNGLAGPLHGLANQECLAWLLDLMKQYGGVPSVAQITKFAQETLAAHRVIPGYGHAVLRVTDPRFTAFVEFGKKHCPDDPVFQTALNVFEAVPAVLKQHPKIKNPWPNVDAVSGSLLNRFGLVERNYYTVLFSVSRALGICAQSVIARAMGQPIIRPGAVTTAWLKEAVAKAPPAS